MTGEQSFFFHWIKERENCREGYEKGLPKPWSDDPILQAYRFCNVRREDDKVTKWIKNNWRDPFASHPNMVLAMVVARTVNWPETLTEIGFPDFSPVDASARNQWMADANQKMKMRRVHKLKVWTGAYLVSTNGNRMDKVDYIIEKVWLPVAKANPDFIHHTLEEAHNVLMKFDGLGSFMAAQVVCDLKYTPVLANASDWNTWSAIGPGSKRGLNRFFGRKLEGNISASLYKIEIAALQAAVQQYCGMALHAQDIQNCLCEFDKYVRVKNDEGKPRSGYNGWK